MSIRYATKPIFMKISEITLLKNIFLSFFTNTSNWLNKDVTINFKAGPIGLEEDWENWIGPRLFTGHYRPLIVKINNLNYISPRGYHGNCGLIFWG